MARVKVFIDYQNVYEDARRAFFGHADPVVRGQFSPRRLGEVLLRRPETSLRALTLIRVYAGRPSTKDAKTYGAHMRQESAWSREKDVTIVARRFAIPETGPRRERNRKASTFTLQSI